MDTQKIASRLDRAGSARITVFGDFALDKYLYIDPARDEPSVETGLTAYQVDRKRCSAGAAGTIVNNLRALGAKVLCVGAIGNDGEGSELIQCLEKVGADASRFVWTEDMLTSTYVKPMRLQPDGSYQEMNRLDFRNFHEPSMDTQKKLIANLEDALSQSDAVIVLDQFVQRNMGTVTDFLRGELGRLAAANPQKIFYADSRAFASEYRNMIVKCNNYEFMALKGGDGDPEDEEAICRQARRLEADVSCTYVVTRGSRGMMVFARGGMRSVPAFPVSGPVDIVGAGDAASAGLVLGLVLGLDMEEAATLACCASSITIQQLGTTGTAGAAQVKERLYETLRGESQ